jgi:hypothetical protein
MPARPVPPQEPPAPPVPWTERVRLELGGLRGRRISRVLYEGLDGDAEGPWDRGDWHHVEQCVWFLLEDGEVFSVGWRTCTEPVALVLEPMPGVDPLAGVGGADGARWEVTGHPRWAPWVGQALVTVDAIWRQSDVAGYDEVPVAVRLGIRGSALWIAAASDQLKVGVDEVVVAFSSAIANRLGVDRLD